MNYFEIATRTYQITTTSLCLILWAVTAGYQAKWDVGPSGLSG